MALLSQTHEVEVVDPVQSQLDATVKSHHEANHSGTGVESAESTATLELEVDYESDSASSAEIYPLAIENEHEPTKNGEPMSSQEAVQNFPMRNMNPMLLFVTCLLLP